MDVWDELLLKISVEVILTGFLCLLLFLEVVDLIFLECADGLKMY